MSDAQAKFRKPCRVTHVTCTNKTTAPFVPLKVDVQYEKSTMTLTVVVESLVTPVVPDKAAGGVH